MRRSARYHKRGNFFGGLISLVLLVALGFVTYKFLPQFLKSTDFDRFNLVIAGSTVNLVSLDKIGKSLTIVRFPNDLYLTGVIHGYGQYKISSVYPAGQLDNRGGETLTGTIREYLGVPVDGYYYADRDFNTPKSYFISPNFIFSAKSNLTLVDRIKFILALWNVRFDRVTDVDLSKFTSPIVLADGSSAQSLEILELDSALNGMLSENKIRDENLRVEIVNTTPTVGIGARVVRLLSNIGLSVVNVDSSSSLLPGCQIEVIESAIQSKTVARIANIYGCKISKKTDEGRAAVTVLLGQDFTSWLSK